MKAIKEIDCLLTKWANKRGITEQKFDRKSMDASQFEEMGEYYTAYAKFLRTGEEKFEHEMIDALADRYIYAHVDSLKPGIGESDIFELEMIEAEMLNEISGLGYDYECVMMEVYKEINSRTGKWSDKEKKWVKDTSPEAKAKWYKANYGKCKGGRK